MAKTTQRKTSTLLRKCPLCGKTIYIPQAKCCLVCNRERLKNYQKEYKRKYRLKPEVTARESAYLQRPEVKERMKKYQQEYLQRPEVKERLRIYVQNRKKKKAASQR